MRFSRKAVTADRVTDVRDGQPHDDPTGHAVSLDDELAKLVDLRDGGTLTKVEFEARKALLLNSWGDGT